MTRPDGNEVVVVDVEVDEEETKEVSIAIESIGAVGKLFADTFIALVLLVTAAGAAVAESDLD